MFHTPPRLNANKNQNSESLSPHLVILSTNEFLRVTAKIPMCNKNNRKHLRQVIITSI